MKKKIITPVVAVVAALALAGVASASVTFDPTTGKGFVGKGDVQTPWGWTNATLQAQAGNVVFAYNETDAADYDVTCEFDTGTIHVVHHVINKSASVYDTVTYDVKSASRTNPRGNVTGFNLTGEGTVVTTGDNVPAVGDPCPGNSDLGNVTSVSDPYNQTSNQELDASDASATPATGPTAVWLNGISVH